MNVTSLYWLPEASDWSERYAALSSATSPAWSDLVSLAGARADMLKTNRLDKLLRRSFSTPVEATPVEPTPVEATPPAPTHAPVTGLRAAPIRLAVLSSSTTEHLVPAIRVAGLRRGLWVDVHLGDYGQYLQELLDEGSALYRAKPDTVLFAFDANHLFGSADPRMSREQADALLEDTAARIVNLWRLARDRLGCHVIQQAVLPRLPALLGANEHRLAGSAANLITELNARLRRMADAERTDLLAVDSVALEAGLAACFDPVLWHRAKQEFSPGAAALYGDLVARLLAARRGLSFKCLVLDLDNTLWGGVIGDDGLEGIKLGQGSALGEAHVDFQRYCKALAHRGVILAVCSKNDEVNARAPFESHPEMILRSADIACFVANWDDKPGNIRRIAASLNIGLDAIAFADDNPFERDIVRRELPMVAVPELPEDPALYAACIADAGYFEAASITAEDLQRAEQYQGNLERQRERESFTDMPAYLKSLDMELVWAPFDAVGFSRIVQLINKTNQFNLTTRRYDEAGVRAIMDDPAALTLQFRLLDRHGDNGMICIIIGHLQADRAMLIDTWLMSCRVLGRQVEQATLNVLAEECRQRGATTILGDYIPSPKNSMVSEHYGKLGFHALESFEDGRRRSALDLARFTPGSTCIGIKRGSDHE